MLFSIVAGFFLSALPIGILFSLMYWQGSKLYLGVGIAGAVLSLAISLILKNKKEQLVHYYATVARRSVVLGAIAVILYLLPLSTQIRIQHWNDKKLAELKYRSYSNPENEAYREELNAYIEQKRAE